MPQQRKFSLPDVTPESHDVGHNIAVCRKKQGLSQKELSEKIGVTQGLLSHYETGRLNIPVEVIIQIALSLNIHSDILLGITSQTDDTLPSRKVLQRLKKIERLPAFDQKALLKTIDNALKGAGISPTD